MEKVFYQLKKVIRFFGANPDKSEIGKADAAEVRREMLVTNARRAKYMLAATLGFELFLIAAHDIPSIIRHGLFGENALYYFLLHSIILITAVSGLRYANLLIRKNSQPPVREASSPKPSFRKGISPDFVQALVIFFIIAPTAMINALDQSFTDSIVVYVAITLMISVLMLMRPPVNLVVYASCHLVFIIGLLIHQHDGTAAAANSINGSIAVISAMIISTTFYHSGYESTMKTVLLRKANRKLEILSTTDSLTGLYNRRYFYDCLETACLAAERHQDSWVLIIFDLDDFKETNDAYGHSFGDQILISFADILKGHCRITDSGRIDDSGRIMNSERTGETCRAGKIAVRWGGEEFVLALQNVTTEQALEIGEQILKTQSRKSVTLGDYRATVTASAGAALLEDCSITGVDRALVHADRALYAAKSEGKNRIVLYQDGQTASGEKVQECKGAGMGDSSSV